MSVDGQTENNARFSARKPINARPRGLFGVQKNPDVALVAALADLLVGNCTEEIDSYLFSSHLQ